MDEFDDDNDGDSWQESQFSGTFLTMQSLKENTFSACKVIRIHYDENK